MILVVDILALPANDLRAIENVRTESPLYMLKKLHE